jgi:hypothetical protein
MSRNRQELFPKEYEIYTRMAGGREREKERKKGKFTDYRLTSLWMQAPMADLLRVHDYAYIANLQRECRRLGADAIGFLDPPGNIHTYIHIYIYICMYVCMYVCIDSAQTLSSSWTRPDIYIYM